MQEQERIDLLARLHACQENAEQLARHLVSESTHRAALELEVERLRADADPEALQIVYWMGYYAGRDKARGEAGGC